MGKIAIVGVGYWGSKLLRSMVSLVGADHVVAVEPDVSRQAWMASHNASVPCRSSFAEVLSDPAVEAVVVASPVHTHAEYAAAALDSGRHVLVEKPLCTSVARASELIELADRRQRILMVGHTFLFSPRVQWIARRLATTGIGEMQYLMASRLNLGTHREDVDVLWDLAPHDVSVMLSLLGESPISVHANARGVLKDGIPDVAFVDLTFPTGVLASIAVSWLAPRKVRSLVIVGAESMIVYDDLEAQEPVKVYDKGLELESSTDFGAHQLTYRYGDTVAPHIPVHEPITEQIAHFLQCAKSGERPISDGRFGRRVIAVLDAAERSWRDGGRPVAVEAVG